MPDVLGKQADAADGNAIRGDQPKRFAELAAKHGLAILPQAQALMAAVRRRRLAVVIATSSGQAQIDSLERYSRWAFTGDADLVVKADDAAASKTAPDLVAAAVAKAGLSPAQCVMLGDTPYDATSANRAGVVTLGVTCGGNPADVLLRAGARGVYRDLADVLADLDAALALASPSPAHLTRSTIEFLMGEALTVAGDNLADGGLPIGTVLAGGDGSVVGRAVDGRHRSADPPAHADRLALSALGAVPPDLILVMTLEPCVMCAAAAMEAAAVDTVVFGLRSPADDGPARVTPPAWPGARMPRFVGGVRAAETAALFRRWLERHGSGGGATVAAVRQLLGR